jgi:hypothetical protein
MPISALAEVLLTLADAQELSERLPPMAYDRETVALVVASMKVLHRDITGVSGHTEAVIDHTRATMARAREVLTHVDATWMSGRQTLN